MWSSTVGLVNGKHRYLTAETFGFKINSNGQVLKKRQQWTIEPFPENLGPDGSISSAASVSSQAPGQLLQHQLNQTSQPFDPTDPCILTFSCGAISSSLTSIKSSNGSSASDQETCSEEHENVAIKSHLNKYLAVDSFGNVTCDSEEKAETARFTITICSMSQGRSKEEHIFWAFKNVERGYYLGTTDDGMICCNAKMPKSRAELWHLHLLPARGASFFALKSLGRKRYARFVPDQTNDQLKVAQNGDLSKSQVQLDATITWGPEMLFQFKYYEGGRYSLLTSDCMYLTNEGKCVSWTALDDTEMPPVDCLFTVEYHSGFLAFRDSFSHYLAAAGRSSILRSRSIGVSRDELFVFEPAPVQVAFKATFNNRWVSIKQGVDLTANQMEISSEFETFQLTFHKLTQNWSIMTRECNFWTVSQNTNTVSVCKPGDYEGLTRGQFKLVWSETDATCSLKYIASNNQERWIAARKSGQLFLGGGAQIPVKFIVRLQNRRTLNLRPVEGTGFVGLKVNSKQLEANKTAPDSIAVEYSELPSLNPINGVGCAPLIDLHPAVFNSESIPVEEDLVDSSTRNQTINLFNVKLNSTKVGQRVLDRLIDSNSTSKDDQVRSTQVTHSNKLSKEVDSGIDDNNNSPSSDDIDLKPNGSVESGSTPSVASIINSFSNAKVSNVSSSNILPPGANTQQTNMNQSKINSTVFKLASSFNSKIVTPKESHLSDATSDTASVITSCSVTSASSSVLSNSSMKQEQAANSTKVVSSFDQLGQFECCYLKMISNDKYIVVSDKDTNVVCDATNKACAQSWILELRSQNSVAIRASDNHAYMQLGTNGTISVSRCEPRDASLWEF